MRPVTAVAAMTLLCGLWSCRFPNLSPCDIAPVNLTIEATDSVRVGQTMGLQAHFDKGFFPACAGTWSSENTSVLLVKASSTTTTSAYGLAPGAATVKLLIGTDSALAVVTVTP